MDKTIALIGGTGLARGLEAVLDDPQVYRDVTVEYGQERGTVLFYLEAYSCGLRVLVLPRHGPRLELPDRSPAELIQQKGHEAHVWFLHQSGVDAVYSFSAVGALDPEIPLANEQAFVVPHDFGRGVGATVHSFGELAKVIHPNMEEPFAPHLRQQVIRDIEAAGARAIREGVYIYNGPDQFESTAEIRAVARLYAGERNRMVGMTAGPELALCKQMGLPYVLICSNSNYAQGVRDRPVTHELVLSVMKGASESLLRIAREIIRSAAEEP